MKKLPLSLLAIVVFVSGCKSSDMTNTHVDAGASSDGSVAMDGSQVIDGSAGVDAAGHDAGHLPRMLTVTASALPTRTPATTTLVHTKSRTDPAPDEYEGMGIHSGESVVLGLKIWLTGISFSTDTMRQVNAFDWHGSPRELQIENGFSGAIEDTTPLMLPPGTYTMMGVSYQSRYSLKAYSYLDTDANGDIDTTIYTTATGVRSVAMKAALADLTDLDYYAYGFTYSYNADSTTAATTTSGDITHLPTPLVIEADGSPDSDAGVDPNDAGHGDAGEVTLDANVNVSIFVDSFRIVKSWDGAAGMSPSDEIDVIFPQGVGEGRTNSYGIALTDLYPFGHPTFGLEYIPTFAFINATGYVSETYLVAPSAPFVLDNSQPMTVIFDAAGVPITGRTHINNWTQSLQLGQAAHMFTESPAGSGMYRYFVEYGIHNTSGADDGGLYYHNDPSMAGHIVDGFQHLGAVGDTGTISITDGPRCAGEYNHCFGPRMGVTKRVR